MIKKGEIFFNLIDFVEFNLIVIQFKQEIVLKGLIYALNELVLRKKHDDTNILVIDLRYSEIKTTVEEIEKIGSLMNSKKHESESLKISVLAVTPEQVAKSIIYFSSHTNIHYCIYSGLEALVNNLNISYLDFNIINQEINKMGK